jgi:FG-GAP-like repeat/Beta-propeller repeat/Putative binding domain, N-terminal
MITHLRPQWKSRRRQRALRVPFGHQRISVIELATFLLLFLITTNAVAQRLIQYPTPDSSHSMGQIPIYFEQNDGQADESARFVALNGRLKALITKNGLAFPHGKTFITMQVRDGSVTTFQPEEPTVGVSNYYLGRRVLTGLKHYGRVRGHNIRPGIDIVFHSNETQLEYDFEVHPGGRPDLLRLGFSGVKYLDLETNGDIRLVAENDELRLRKLDAWQDIRGQRKRIECSYRISPNEDVELILGPYDHSRQLTIDPVISFSTYLSSGGEDNIAAVAVDTTGVYVTGSSYTTNFPVTSGTNQGKPGLFVTKFNPSGTALLYSTIIAGGGGLAIAADGLGDVYVAGTAGSDYSNTTTVSGGHLFVTKLNSSGQISYATLLAGNVGEQAQAIAIDSSGAAYVAGFSESSNFPVTAGALKTTLSGTQNAVVAKLNASGQVIYATYLGGSTFDNANGIAIDGAGNAYVAGLTSSSDFPTTPGAYSTSFPVGSAAQDGFVTEINPTGSAIVSSTLLGGSISDLNIDNYATGIARDLSGNLYVAGWTNATNFPATYSVGLNEGSALFVTKFNSSLSSILYSVTVGTGFTTLQQFPAIAVDESGAAYVSATAIPQGLITPGGFDTGAIGNLSFLQVAPSGNAISYAGLFGAAGFFDEIATSIAIDGSGGVYLTGYTAIANFPTTAGAYQTSAQAPIEASIGDQSGLLVKIDMTSPTSCLTSLGPTPGSIPANGGSFSFDFTIPAGCPWGVAPQAGSGPILSGQTVGISSGAAVPVNGALPPNPSTSQQTVNIYVSEKTVPIVQAAASCDEPVVSPSPLIVDAAGDLEDVNVTLPNSCDWTAAVNVPWLTLGNLYFAGYQTGSWTLTLSSTPFSYSQRTGTMTISNETFTVTQTGTGTCTASASATQPSPANSGGTGAILISVNQNSCNWSGYSLVPWIQLAAASGQGNGSIPYTVAPNPGAIQRSGQILVADQLVTITQAAGPAGTISSYIATLFAGGNSTYQDGAPAIISAVGSPVALFYDSRTGNFYFVDQQFQKVRVITPDGRINTVAPSLPLVHPNAITVDPSGNIYIGDSGIVWGVTQNGPFAGGGGYGFGGDNGPATSAQLTLVDGLAADSSHVYISDEYNARIRAVSNGIITTIAGGGTTVQSNGDPATQAQLVGPEGLVLDQHGDLVFADGDAIRTVSQGIINTLPVNLVPLNLPQTLAYDVAGNLFITEFGGPLVELSPAGTISFPQPYPVQRALSVATDPSGNVYVGDDANHAVWRLAPQFFCSFTVATPGVQPATGGSLNLNVTTGAGCNWSAASYISWIQVSYGASVTGNGTVQLTIAPNTVGPERSAIIAIAGQPILVTQAGVAGDFNADGHPDLMWQLNSTGQVAIWYLDGAQGNAYESWNWLAAGSMTGWTLRGAADFNGDGHPDLIWQYDATGQVAVWYMGGAQGDTYQSFGWLNSSGLAGWTLVCAADFNGDGHPDLVWQNDSTGQVAVWYMGGAQGNTYQSFGWLASGNMTGWTLVGVADFNGDGHPDLIWQYAATGQVAVWYMGGAQGNTYQSFGWLASGNMTGWTAIGAVDLNADGHPDLIWQSTTTQQVAVWYMGGAQGNTYQSFGWVAGGASPGPGWTAVARLN